MLYLKVHKFKNAIGTSDLDNSYYCTRLFIVIISSLWMIYEQFHKKM